MERFIDTSEFSMDKTAICITYSLLIKWEKYIPVKKIPLTKIVHIYDGTINDDKEYLGVRYTNVEPPIMLEKTRIKVIVVIRITCSPFPEAPKYCDIIIAINKLMMAVINLVPKVFMIFPSKVYLFMISE
jgi:hypothetical protein